MLEKARFWIIVAVLVLVGGGLFYFLRPSEPESPPPLSKTLPSPGASPAKADETSPAAQEAAPASRKSAALPPAALPSMLQSRSRQQAELRKGDERGTGVIFGLVKSAQGAPAPDAEITVERITWKDYEEAPADSLIKKTVSDAAGKFRVTDLPVDVNYGIKASAKGMLGVAAGYLSARAPEREVNLDLDPAAPVSGFVRNTDGERIAGAVVYAHATEADGKARDLPITETTVAREVTNANGEFAFANVPQGRWKFTVKATGYATALTDWVASGASNVEIIVTRGGSVSGQVVAADTHQGLPKVTVTMGSGMQRDRFQAVTNDEGKFSVAGLRAAEYTAGLEDEIMVSSGPPVKFTIAEEEETSGVIITAARGGSIAGRVYDAETQQGITGVKVSANSRDAGVPAKETDASGNYRLTGLSEGEFSVNHGPAEGYGGTNNWNERKQVFIKLGQDIEGIDFPLSRGITVTGTVVDASGNPVALAEIESQCGIGGNWGRAQSKEDGRFELAGLIQTDKFYLKAQKEGLVAPQQGPLQLPAEGLRDLVLTLTPEGTISGKVVDKSGRPVPGVGVMAYPSGEYRFGLPTADADAQGNYRVSKLPAGTYRMILNRPGSHNWNTNKEAATVEVGAGEQVSNITLVYEEAGGLSISGTITNSAGKPVAQAQLNAWGGAGSNSSAESDANGAYRLAGLAEGNYQIQIWHQNYSSANRGDIAAGTDGIDFVLEGKGTISGRVTDAATRQPIKDFEIMQTRGPVAQLQAWFNQQFVKTHHEEGLFVLNGVETGAATVIARAPGYAPTFQVVENVTEGKTVSGVEIALPAGRAVEGTVTDSASQPVSGAMIFLGPVPQEYERERGAATRSATDGTFRIDTVGPDDQLVSAYRSGLAPASAPIPSGGGRIALVLSQGGQVEATVLLGRNPVVDAYVSVYYPAQGGGSSQSGGKTDADGRALVQGLTPGNAVLHVNMPNAGGGPRPGRSRQQTVEIQDGHVTPVTIVFTPGDAAVEGTVSKAGTPVTAYVNATITSADGATENVSTQTDANGHYRLEGLPAGTVRLQVHVPIPGNATMRLLEGATVSGQTTQLDVDLSNGATVAGRVIGLRAGEQGSVVAFNGEVTLPQTYTPEVFQDLQGQMASVSMLTPEGTFRLEGLAPGVYTVLVSAVQGTPRNTADAMSTMRMASGVVRVEGNEERSLELTLR